jgi:putative DNA primase/helicase
LSISVGDSNKPLLYCHAGCNYEDIIKSLENKTNNKTIPKKATKRVVVATYDYVDESGTLVHQTVRKKPKDFLQRRPDGNGGWIWNLKGVKRFLYRLPELLAADKKDWLFIPEGEKDVDRLVDELGLIATTNPMGAGKGKWLDEYSDFIKDRHVVILPDNDDSGRDHAQEIARAIYKKNKAAKIRIVELPELPEHGDVSDWLDKGHTKEDLLKLVQETDPYKLPPPPNAKKKQKTSHHLTDTGNAKRFVSQHKDKIRFCWSIGKWLAFDGQRWNYDTGIVEAQRCALKTVQGIFSEAAKCKDSDQRKQLFKWAFQSEKAGNLKAILSIVRSLPPIATHARDFDKDKYQLNVFNGTIDLHSGQLIPHNPGDMITKLAPVNYPTRHEEASIDLWLSCLSTWHRGDKDAIDYLQQLTGMCLTGDISSRCFPIFYGGGKNGKSVFLDTLMMLMGDYATIAPRTLLNVSRNDEHATEIACLMGKRLVIASESKKNMKLKVALIKAMTGDSRMKARFMRQDFFDFQPTHKTILVTQNLPIIDEASDGIWDRVHKMEWSVRIPDNEQNTHLLEDLKVEWPGILKWAVDGCLKWKKNGRLIPTESIRKQTEEYRINMNPLKTFIDDECVIGPELSVGVIELKSVYDTWLNINGYDERLSAKDFSALMRESGYKKGTARINGKVVKCWFGIGLCNENVDDEELI